MLWHLLQTTDSLFPTGAYAHSGGLEGLVTDGAKDPEELIESILRRAFARVDLPACALAHRAAEAGEEAVLLEIDAVVDSLKGPRETREASRSLGRRRLRSLTLDDRRLASFSRKVDGGATPGHQSVVTGLHLAVAGVPRPDALLSYAYATAAGLAGAAMKLLPFGQTAAQALLTRCGGMATGLIDEADKMALEELGAFTPLLDVASMRHETSYTRIFIS